MSDDYEKKKKRSNSFKKLFTPGIFRKSPKSAPGKAEDNPAFAATPITDRGSGCDSNCNCPRGVNVNSQYGLMRRNAPTPPERDYDLDHTDGIPKPRYYGKDENGIYATKIQAVQASVQGTMQGSMQGTMQGTMQGSMLPHRDNYRSFNAYDYTPGYATTQQIQEPIQCNIAIKDPEPINYNRENSLRQRQFEKRDSKCTDTSSSSTTLMSDNASLSSDNRNYSPESEPDTKQTIRNDAESMFAELKLQEINYTKADVYADDGKPELIKTNAVIPLNTERAIPNPYHTKLQLSPSEIAIFEPLYGDLSKQDGSLSNGNQEVNGNTDVNGTNNGGFNGKKRNIEDLYAKTNKIRKQTDETQKDIGNNGKDWTQDVDRMNKMNTMNTMNNENKDEEDVKVPKMDSQTRRGPLILTNSPTSFHPRINRPRARSLSPSRQRYADHQHMENLRELAKMAEMAKKLTSTVQRLSPEPKSQALEPLKMEPTAFQSSGGPGGRGLHLNRLQESSMGSSQSQGMMQGLQSSVQVHNQRTMQGPLHASTIYGQMQSSMNGSGQEGMYGQTVGSMISSMQGSIPNSMGQGSMPSSMQGSIPSSMGQGSMPGSMQGPLPSSMQGPIQSTQTQSIQSNQRITQRSPFDGLPQMEDRSVTNLTTNHQVYQPTVTHHTCHVADPPTRLPPSSPNTTKQSPPEKCRFFKFGKSKQKEKNKKELESTHVNLSVELDYPERDTSVHNVHANNRNSQIYGTRNDVQKEINLQQMEAYYWTQIQELKKREDEMLKQQLYGTNTATTTHRSRDMNVGSQRRSKSLPRNVKPLRTSDLNEINRERQQMLLEQRMLMEQRKRPDAELYTPMDKLQTMIQRDEQLQQQIKNQQNQMVNQQVIHNQQQQHHQPQSMQQPPQKFQNQFNRQIPPVRNDIIYGYMPNRSNFVQGPAPFHPRPNGIQNFQRGSNQRSTISTTNPYKVGGYARTNEVIVDAIYENTPGSGPIFKKGSLTNDIYDINPRSLKKVSFNGRGHYGQSTEQVKQLQQQSHQQLQPQQTHQQLPSQQSHQQLQPQQSHQQQSHQQSHQKLHFHQRDVVNSNEKIYGYATQTGVIYGELKRSPTFHNGFVSKMASYPALSPSKRSPQSSMMNLQNRDVYGTSMTRPSRPPGYIPAPNRPLPPLPRDANGMVQTIQGVQPVQSVQLPPTIERNGRKFYLMDAGLGEGLGHYGYSTGTEYHTNDEEWSGDNKSGRNSGDPGGGAGTDGELRSRGRSNRREDPRRHTLSGDQHMYQGRNIPQGGILARTMDLEHSFPRGYFPPSNPMLLDDDPGIMSEVETSSTGFRRGGKQRSSLPVVRTPSKTLERPLGLVFLQYRNETKRALLPNEITSIDTVKALFVRSFPKQLTMEYLDSPHVKIYIHDSSKDMFYELEDVRSHLRDIRDRSVLRLFEAQDVSGGLPGAGIGISGGVGMHFDDPSYFSEPEFDSDYQHQHIHKSKSNKNAAPYYVSSASLPRGALLRTYSPAVGAPVPPERLKSLPGQTDGYMSSPERGSRNQYEDPYYSQYGPRTSGSITPVIDEEASDSDLRDDSYSLYGVKLPSNGTAPRVPAPRTQFASGPASVPYDVTRLRVEHMERQLANLTGLVQKALTHGPTTLLAPPGRDAFGRDEFDKHSSSSCTSLPDDTYLRTDMKAPKLGKSSCHKSVSFEKSVSFSDEPPDMNSPKQHSPQHTADSKPTKPAIKSSTLPRTSSQERDRLKPAPPPKPPVLVTTSVSYDGTRNLYRDLQLTPEMYNQLRGLQKKAKDLRAEVRNLRRMSQAQAHSVRETIRDTFIKIRSMLIIGGEQSWLADVDKDKLRLSREEDLYKQEMLRLEADLTELESTVEELRGNVINRKTRVNMSDVENMALILSKSSKTVADLKVRFPSLQDGMKNMLTSEMERVLKEEKFLKDEPDRLESALRRCKKLTGTLVTLKRLASVQEQRLPCATAMPADDQLSPPVDETPPVTPTSAQHGKPPVVPNARHVVTSNPNSDSEGSQTQRPENALDALLDELQTFSKPHPLGPPTHSTHQGHAPPMSDIGRKSSMNSHPLTVSTGMGSLRRLHSYPSGSDTDSSPPIQPAPRTGSKPPLPERNSELIQAVTGRRVPPPPPPRTSSRSPLASPTSPGLPPRAPTGLQHIQNVQTIMQQDTSTLRRNRSNSTDGANKAQTLPRNLGSNLQVHSHNLTDAELQSMMMSAAMANTGSSSESVNSQDGTKKGNRQEQLEQRHQELLKKQKALQEQYARLQQLQRGTNALTVVPPAPDLLKKTGSESNILQKMGLNIAPAPFTGSLTHIPKGEEKDGGANGSVNNATQVQTSKVYETDIL